MKIDNLIDFATPYYKNKDIMHNLWHIELVLKWAKRIIEMGKYDVEEDIINTAVYFHGFINSNEDDIRDWLVCKNLTGERIEKIITVAKESHKDIEPKTLEGKILHDAHMIEGGKTYMITKCLITGSVRGQTLPQTIEYIENNILDKGKCYLPETIPLFEEANDFAKDFIEELKKGLQ